MIRLECPAVRLAPFLFASVISTGAIAAPFAVQVGDARLALDTPPGFSDVQMTGSPRLLELGEALTSASNRILLFALEDADVRRFSLGDPPQLRRYVIAVTPKGLVGPIQATLWPDPTVQPGMSVEPPARESVSSPG